MRVLFCGVCGSDIFKWRNRSVPPGTVLGHEVVAEVVENGADLKGGDRVAVANHIPCGECGLCRKGKISMCDRFKSTSMFPGGFSEYVKVGVDHVLHGLIPLPAEISNQQAVLIEPLGCCIRALDRWPIRPGDTVMVVGLGVMGVLFGVLLKDRGLTVVGVDPIEGRRAVALEMGMDCSISPADEWVEQRIDGVVLTVCTDQTVRYASKLLGKGGWIGLFAGPDSPRSILVPLLDLYNREIDLISSYSTGPEEMRRARDFLARGDVDLGGLITHVFPLKEISLAFETAMKQRGMKVVVRMG